MEKIGVVAVDGGGGSDGGERRFPVVLVLKLAAFWSLKCRSGLEVAASSGVAPSRGYLSF